MHDLYLAIQFSTTVFRMYIKYLKSHHFLCITENDPYITLSASYPNLQTSHNLGFDYLQDVFAIKKWMVGRPGNEANCIWLVRLLYR